MKQYLPTISHSIEINRRNTLPIVGDFKTGLNKYITLKQTNFTKTILLRNELPHKQNQEQTRYTKQLKASSHFVHPHSFSFKSIWQLHEDININK